MKPELVEDIYPLAPLQRGILFHSLLDGHAGDYVTELAFRIDGALDPAAFEDAWRAAVARHPALRTAFVWEGVQEPVQVVLRSVELAFAREDWRGLDPAARERRLDALLADERRRGFELAQAPLLRFVLAREDERAWRFVWIAHHLLFDGWSLPRILGDVLALYSGRGELPAVRPYRDYVTWLARRDPGGARAFWSAYLEGLAAPTPLPGRRARRSTEGGDRWRTRELRLPAPITARLAALARANGLTPSTLVQGAWALLLARHADLDEVVFGATRSGRPPDLEGVESIVGLFINSLPLRVALPPEMRLVPWLAELQRAGGAISAFEWTPLPDVARAGRREAGEPLFESLVVFENYPLGGLEDAFARAGLAASSVRSEERTNYPLNLIATPGPELALCIASDEAVVEEGTGERLLGGIAHLLESFAERPDARLAELSPTSDAERRLLLGPWAHGGPVERQASVAELFAEQVLRTPDAVALEHGERARTYRELDRDATALACVLRGHGVGPERVVAVLLEPSIDLATACIAVAKAGGAWLALDPSHPSARRAAILADAEPAAIVTSRALAETLPPSPAPVVLAGEASASVDGAIDAGASPSSLAYVVYTSGSTGAPKGVEVTHAGVASLVRATARAAEIGPGTRVAQLSAVGFDVFALELLATLLEGATLCFLDADERVPGPRLARALERCAIDLVFLSPTVLRELDPADVPRLATLVVGGEPSEGELLARWSASRRVVHAYGPAEATVTVAQDVAGSWRRDPSRAPGVGRPIEGFRAYVLDHDLAPVPIGATGELCLAGPGLARGYRGRARATAERFVPDPFARADGSPGGGRLYRTGDLARWRPDDADGLGGAELEIQGRLDQAIKVRGVRVEPAEVEAALRTHPSVRQAAVDLRAIGGGEPRLCGWFVAAEGAAPEPAALRRFLAERLPAAFVPARLFAQQTLPRTSHGKLDRAALSVPDADVERVSRAPEGPVEERLAACWSEVLGIPSAGADEDFFERGGDSLRALQLVARVRDELAVDLPLRALFEAPTIALLARRIDALAAGGAEKLPGEPALEPLEASHATGPAPLSFAQERLWFLDRLDPASAAYLMPLALRLRGLLDAAALERALGGLVRRHAALRTRFEETADGPVQVVADVAALPLARVDLAGHASPADAARELAAAEARAPFDLARAPLARATLLRLADGDHVLCLVVHHIAADGWSVGILCRELGLLYAEEIGGPPARLPDLRLAYDDWARWQREPGVRARAERDLAFWCTELEGAPQVLALPTDRARPPVQTYRGLSVALELDRELSQSLVRLARAHDATPFALFAAATAAWLARLSGQDDLLIGTPIAGRTEATAEPLVGLFVNTLVLRARLGDDPAFDELVRRMRARSIDLQSRPHAPFEHLVERLVAGRDLSRAPLCQALLVFQNLAAEEPKLPGLRCERFAADPGVSKLDLLLEVAPKGGAFMLTLEVNADLFEADTARAWLAALAELLRSAAADPARRISALGLASAPERERLARLGRGPATHPRAGAIGDRFREQVARTPAAIAVAFDTRSLTYRELDRLATALAHRLRARGVGPEVQVALLAERSLEMVVGMLAILRAGGAYVPLDPAYPDERLAWMLAHSRAPLLLAQERLLGKVAGSAVPVVPLDGVLELATEEQVPLGPLARGGPLARAENLAYVMYTSGSTGRPKAVGVDHRGVLRLLCGEPFAELGPGEVVLQFVSIAFDVSVFEIWGALLSGARLEIFAPRVPSLHELGAFVRERAVTAMWLTTPLFNQMVDERLEDLAGVRQLLAGGEALSAPHVTRALAALPSTRLVNGYGPTEVTTFTTSHAFRRGEAVPRAVPIGQPINGTDVHVLDARLEPVPLGAFGELLASGDGLARGYLGDPRLTAERFLPDPCAREPGSRMYRTGDRVRWRADGPGSAVLEYQGRIDRQVKVRGYRIELGEVEAVLAQHPGIRQSAVDVRGAGDQKRLVAWFAPAGELRPSELAQHLRAKLPEPMVPSRWIRLDALPLSANGKVDRRALSEPESAPAAAAEALHAHGSLLGPEEELCAGALAAVLGLERVGRHDDFFELGGHSLLATRLVARLRDLFGVELPLQRVFERPTAAGLARAVADARGGETADAPEPIATADRAREIPLSFAESRMWFLERLQPGSPVHHTPFALELEGSLDVEVLRACFDDVRARHEILRTSFPEHRGRPRRSILSAELLPPFALPVVDLAQLASEEQARAVRERTAAHARAAFDLAAGPLIRAELLRLGPERHVLSVALHHVVSDGWSLSVLGRELGASYAARRAGRTPELDGLPVQVADVAAWQRGAMSGTRLESERAWWRAALGDAPQQPELGRSLPPEDPRDSPAPPRAGGVLLELEAEVVRALETLARAEGLTPFMLLLAAFQALLARASGRTDFVIGAPVAGRTRRETEGLIGNFVNLLALRADVAGDPTFRELARRARRTTLAAYEHQELPVEELAPLLAPGLGREHAPRSEVFGAMFTLHSTPLAHLELEGIGVRRVPVDLGVPYGELWLAVEPLPTGAWRAYWQYDAARLDGAAVERLAAAWRRILEAVLAAPEVRVHELPLVGAAERAALERAGTGPDRHDAGATVPALFAAQVARTPLAPAVVFGGATWTYAELGGRADVLARHLARLGIGPGAVVGVCCERSFELVLAFAGVARAGGAYLPLDPGHPIERRARILDDAGAAILLTQAVLAGDWPAVGPWIVALDDWDAIVRADERAGPSAGATGRAPAPADLACVMTTSGSTGRPKLVGVPHRAIVRLVQGSAWAELGEREVLLQLAPAAFDASTFEIWGALLNGARLEVFPPRTPSLEELGAFVRERGVTTMWLTAGLFHQMVDRATPDLAGLRQLLAGGEALSAPHVARASAALPGTRLVNGYGPTECTTFTACHAILPGEISPRASVPIGTPIGGTRVQVLGLGLAPVPIGVFGELCVSGDGLARGYLGDPRLTAERFVPDPAREPGSRMYRTGDRVRWRTARDGGLVLEFGGRLDRQLKLRGHRVEPGEVEAALLAHAAVRACAVELRGEDERRRLVAWVATDGASAGAADLAAFLRARLPEPMVPSAFVLLEELPLTANGKVDRRALPEPGLAPDDEPLEPASRAPDLDLVADVFLELLELARVRDDDDFFDLGGHSLLATQLVSRLRDLFGVALPLQRVFESPTVLGVARAVEEARRLAKGAEPEPVLTRAERPDEIPLSFAQSRLWFLERLAPGSAVYHTPFALDLSGPLDATALRASFEDVRARHEALRTSFEERGGRPRQAIAPAELLPPFELPEVDLAPLAAAEQAHELERLAAAFARAPFDLSRGPLIRAELLRLAPERHVLLVSLHHVVSDGWSLSVLGRELGRAYAARLTHRAPELAPLPVQYADFALWQRERMTGPRLERELAWWRAALRDAPEALELGLSARISRRERGVGGQVASAIEPELARRVHDLARAEGVTVFMVLLAAFQALLARVTERSDFVLGAPIAGRARREAEGLIGFFVNTLALRADVAGDPTFRELCARVRAATLAAYDHQDLPFERLVHELAPERARDPSGRHALFQVLFALQSAPPVRLELPGLSVRAREIPTAAPHADLVVAFQPEDDGSLSAWWEHDLAALAPREVERLAAALHGILTAVVAAPDTRVSALPLLAPEERARAIASSRSAAPVPHDDPGLWTLFERAAARAPDSPAVIAGPESTSYAALRARALALAGALERNGLDPGERLVGLCVRGAGRLAAGVLGILRAGAGYLPLDPSLPDERLALLLADAEVRVVVCGADGAARFERLGVRTLDIDASFAAGAAPERAPTGGGDALAYAIYTSGSTGVPKGCLIEQRSVARLVLGTDYVDLRPGHRVAAAANPAFDAATFELFGALLNGAALVEIEKELLLEPDALARTLRERGVTHLFLTTALFQMVARARPEAFATLDTLLFGGEACDAALVRAVLAAPPRRLLHVYGPTETTTFAAWHEVRSLAPDATHVPIGRPVAGAELLVLDRNLEPVLPGFPGELCIGGPALARGYLGRGRASASAFVPHPFSERPGARLYRTGDVVARDERGDLVFLGRRDAQIKLRGHRIEPGEVERALCAHPSVREAAVGLRESPALGRHLVAWIVPRAGAEPSPAELALHLARALPEFMRPKAFVALDALPLSRTGKLDRAALPAPGPSAAVDAADAAPADEVEELVAAVFGEVLGRERAGVLDDFFELGGHSLLAAQVVARVAARASCELPLRALFEAPTVRELAAKVAAARGAEAAVDPIPASPPAPLARTGPLSPAQERLAFLQELDPASAFYRVPFALRITGPLDGALLARALTDLAQRHEALRSRIELRDGAPVQVVLAEPWTELRRLDLSPLSADERDLELGRVRAAFLAEPLELARDPWRALLVRLSEREHVLCVVLHHVFADGASLEVLVRELGVLYGALATGRAARLPAVQVQPIEHARWLRDRIAAPRFAERLAWWKERLAGAPDALDLPADHPRPAVQAFRGGTVEIELPPVLSAAILDLARASGATPFMALLAGFAALLARTSGQHELAIGTPVSGRERAELEGTVGCLVDTVVLRADLAGDPSFRELLRRVRALALDALGHADVPFERVVEALRPRRDAGRTPLFQVMFAWQSAALASTFHVGDLALEPLPLDTDTAKFDLTLAMSERGGPSERRIAGGLEYDADLLDRATAERLARRLAALLAAAVRAPDLPLSRLDWIGADERARLLRLGVHPAREEGEPELVHRLFERCAARDPAALAIADARSRLTYGELALRARILARALRSIGVGRESVVGLCAERSCELAIGALAVLEAGAAYLALDPEHPAERLASTLADAGARAVLSTRQSAAALAGARCRVLAIDDDAAVEALAAATRALPADDSIPADAAYLITTSGSTGRPKGCVVPHRGLANLVRWHARTYRVEPADRASLLAGTSFDASVWELWPYLASGASVHVAPDEVRLDPARLVRWIAERGITLAFLPTPLAEAVLDEAWPADTRLRALLTGGDRLHGRGRGARSFALVNHYGPTEASVVATAGAVGDADGLPPIGRPIAGVRAYVLDRHLEPVPEGVVGELWLGGAGLARGYLGRPAATAEAFAPDSFAPPDASGARLYRTGDLVAWRSDGSLAFHGRADRQLKLRGQRVEPGEIEAALAALPGVRQAAVVARASGASLRLAAYVVPAEGSAIDAVALGARLAERLPESMVPADWVVLERLPTTSSGKIDRAALPAPEAPRTTPSAGEPATELEARVARIWCQVLGRSAVERDANFFDEGGHSLALLAVRAALAREPGREVRVVDLFAHPTVRGLARFLEERVVTLQPHAAEQQAGQPRAGRARAEQRLRTLEERRARADDRRRPAR